MPRQFRTARPFSYGTSARYKLGLNLPGDRAAAAKILREARAFNRRLIRDCNLKQRWLRHLNIAAAFAVQEAEMADDDRSFRVYDYIAEVMEQVSDLKDLMPAE